jgi:hypothetical protein
MLFAGYAFATVIVFHKNNVQTAINATAEQIIQDGS